MGYESRIYIVKKYNRFFDDDKRYAEEIAMLDMCKCYDLSSILTRYPATDCYIYADDGNTRIDEDRYGDPLKETPLKEAIQILKKVIKNSEWEYWRYNVLLATMKAIYDSVGDDSDFVVLHYGY